MIYNSLQLGIFTTMIGFITWPPFLYHHLYKGGQVTKPIIVVKMPGCKLLYIIPVKGFSWPYLISKILVTYNYSYNATSDWPHTFFTAMLFLFSIWFTNSFDYICFTVRDIKF